MFGEFQIFDFRFASLMLNEQMIDGAEIYREGVSDRIAHTDRGRRRVFVCLESMFSKRSPGDVAIGERGLSS